MTRKWKEQFPNKLPWDYHKVFWIGAMKARLGGHAVAWVWTFGSKYTIEIYDSAQLAWRDVFKNIVDWFKYLGMPEDKNVEYIYNEDVPHQNDPFNCAQYAMIAIKALMRNKKPDYSDFTPDPEEMEEEWKLHRKYQPGRRKWYGAKIHPTTDKVVERFSKIKQKDYLRMKKWQTKEMKGFK
jgi:hypothetical protein